MNIRKHLILLFFIFLLILVNFFSGCTEQKKGEDFVFTDLEGEEKHLSDYYGKIILLDLMGVNCQPCQYQLFILHSIYENYSQEDIEIISIDVWVQNGETAGLVKQLIQEYKDQVGLSLDWIFGLDDNEGTIFNKYTNGAVPTLILLDRNGNIYYTFTGITEYSEIARKIDEKL